MMSRSKKIVKTIFVAFPFTIFKYYLKKIRSKFFQERKRQKTICSASAKKQNDFDGTSKAPVNKELNLVCP